MGVKHLHSCTTITHTGDYIHHLWNVSSKHPSPGWQGTWWQKVKNTVQLEMIENLRPTFTLLRRCILCPLVFEWYHLSRCLCCQLRNEWWSDTAVNWQQARHSSSPRWSGTDLNSSVLQSCLWTHMMDLSFTGKQTLGFSKAAPVISSDWTITN